MSGSRSRCSAKPCSGLKASKPVGKISVSIPFLLVITAVIALDSSGFWVLSLLACAVHELGHLCAIALQGRSINSTKLCLTGAEMQYGGKQCSYQADIALALSGPLANALCALVFAFVAKALPNEQVFAFIGINAVIGAFNLLPTLPLDGGRAMLALLQMKLCQRKTQIIMTAVAIVLGGVCSAVGLWVLVAGKGNFTLLVCGLYILSGSATVEVK